MSKYDFKLVFYYTITPLHIGCGQEVGLVDNPIIREKTTGFPFIPGSGIRGVLRDLCEGKPECITLFGPEPEEDLGEDDHAGCISIHDARIFLFPVRTSVNLFHWITCPYVIDRFNRDVKYFQLDAAKEFSDVGGISLSDNQFISIDGVSFPNGLFLEEFPFQQFKSTNGKEKNFGEWLKNNSFQITDEDKKRILIVNNHVFDYFVQHATIVQQHNRLTSAKTVAEGALFSVESVPPETLFYGIIGGTRDRANYGNTFKTGKESIAEILNYLKNGNGKSERMITLGGDESTGLGVTRMFWDESSNEVKEKEAGNGKS